MRLIFKLVTMAIVLLAVSLSAESDLFLQLDRRYETKYAERFLLQEILQDKERLQFKGYSLLKDESIAFYIENGQTCLTAKLNQKNEANGFIITDFINTENTIIINDLFEQKTVKLKLGEIALKKDSAKITIFDSKNRKSICFGPLYETQQLDANEALKLISFDTVNNSATLIYTKDKNIPIMMEIFR